MKQAFTLLLLVLLTATVGFAQVPASHGADGHGIDQQPGQARGIFIPNAFTPNGDGVNDEFYIPDANLSNFQFTVFDRWGNQVYQTFSPDFRWNGQRGGRHVAAGTYVYVLQASTSTGDTIKRSGQLSVVR